jgi:hypothetical protein
MARTQSAAQVIKDELKQARQAVTFYTKRIEALEDILATLSSIDAPVTASRSRAAKKAATSKVPTKTAEKPERTGAKGIRSSKLPATGKDFWLGLLTDTPQSAADVFKAAIATLRIRPNPEDRKKLSQRMANALSILAKDGAIKGEGEHRSRLYSKNSGNTSQA